MRITHIWTHRYMAVGASQTVSQRWEEKVSKVLSLTKMLSAIDSCWQKGKSLLSNQVSLGNDQWQFRVGTQWYFFGLQISFWFGLTNFLCLIDVLFIYFDLCFRVVFCVSFCFSFCSFLERGLVDREWKYLGEIAEREIVIKIVYENNFSIKIKNK